MDHRRQLLILSLFVMLAVVSFAVGKDAEAVRLIDGGKTLSFGNGKSRLLLDAQTFTLVDIIDATQDIHYVVEPGGPLFSITFYLEAKEQYQKNRMWVTEGLVAEKRWWQDTSTPGVNRLTLHYDGSRIGEGGWGSVDVTVTIEIADDETIFHWSLSLQKESKRALAGKAITPWSLPLHEKGHQTLYDVRFPTLRGLGSSVPGSADTDFVVVPYNSGVKRRNPRKKFICDEGWVNYPGFGMTVQLLPYCDGKGLGGLYFATEDTEGYRKTYVNQPMPSMKSFMTLNWHHADARMDDEGNWTLPYRVGAGPVVGDYYDAAKIYRRWMISTGHWKPLSQRDDIPAWFLDLSIWLTGWNRWNTTPPETMDEFADTLVQLRKLFGEDYGFHWYMWWGGKKMDYAYPQYLPPQPGFKEAIAKVQKAGVRVMPYVNVQLFDRKIPMWKEENAAQWAIRLNDQNFPTRERKTALRANTSMCPATPYWQDKISGIYATLVNEYGADAVYMDELHTFPHFCQATNHGHMAPMGGTAFADGFRQIIKKVKAKANKKIAITGEACAEVYADLLSGQLSGYVDLIYNPLFLFQYVMSDRTIDYGMRMHKTAFAEPDAFAAKIGFSFVNGRQLLWGYTIKNFGYSKWTDHTPQLEALIRFARARRAGKDFLLYGEFLRKPDLTSVPTHDVLWLRHEKPKLNHHDMHVVQASVYRAENGDIGLVLANISGREQTITVPTNTKDWGLVPGNAYTVSEWRAGAWSEPEKRVMGRTVEVGVPGYSPVIVRYGALAKK